MGWEEILSEHAEITGVSKQDLNGHTRRSNFIQIGELNLDYNDWNIDLRYRMRSIVMPKTGVWLGAIPNGIMDSVRACTGLSMKNVSCIVQGTFRDSSE